jgi:hypothetical protein
VRGTASVSHGGLETRFAQQGVTAPAATWRSATTYETKRAAGAWSSTSASHTMYWSSSHPLQNGSLTHPNDVDAPLHIAAQRKINSYRQQYADNQNISFLPAITSTSTRMHGDFLRLLFLQAHRETEANFTATGIAIATQPIGLVPLSPCRGTCYGAHRRQRRPFAPYHQRTES